MFCFRYEADIKERVNELKVTANNIKRSCKDFTEEYKHSEEFKNSVEASQIHSLVHTYFMLLESWAVFISS